MPIIGMAAELLNLHLYHLSLIWVNLNDKFFTGISIKVLA
jgi:hypothetical protein